jgi:segregation and condensation protein A
LYLSSGREYPASAAWYNQRMTILWHKDPAPMEFTTEEYSGPLDLLLDLIQKAELDISRLSLAKVTDQFLSYVNANQDANPEYISEFLVIASKLIQIKSEALLPRPPLRQPDEEDPGEALARQLLLYREIKKTTAWMNDRIAQNLRSYLHLPPKYAVNVKFDLSGLDAQDLILALEGILERELPPGATRLISIPRLTLQRKVQEVIGILRTQEASSYRKMLGDSPTRLDQIVLFLAVLELVKQRLVRTSQEAIFGDIELVPEEALLVESLAEVEVEE